MSDKIIKTEEQFRKFLEEWEDQVGVEFKEDLLKKEKSGQLIYETFDRDECNFKASVDFYWTKKTGLSFSGGLDETGDDVDRILQSFRPSKDRIYTVYVKLDIRAANEKSSLELARKAVRTSSKVKFKGAEHNSRCLVQA